MPTPPLTLAGLGSLAALKAAVFPAGMQTSTDFDAPLLTIGRGVAGAFDAYLDRKLARAVDAYTFADPDAPFIIVDRYPVETVSAVDLLAIGADPQTGWQDYLAALPFALNSAAGLLTFQTPLEGGSVYASRLRVKSTGGFWLDLSADLSGTDADGEEIPAGATPLPPDLFNAWTLQVAAECSARNIAGLGVIQPDTEKPTAAFRGYRFVPAVLEILDGGYRRL